MRRLDGSEFEARHLIAIGLGIGILVAVALAMMGCDGTNRTIAEKIQAVDSFPDAADATHIGTGIYRTVDCRMGVACYTRPRSSRTELSCVRISGLGMDRAGICP